MSNNIADLEKLAQAEKRIKALINKEKQSYSEFVQAATEFHKPGYSQAKKDIDDVKEDITDIHESQIQKTLSKIPTQGAAGIEQAAIKVHDIFFGPVQILGTDKYVFGVSTYAAKIIENKDIDYHLELGKDFISAIKTDGSKWQRKSTGILLDFLAGNRDPSSHFKKSKPQLINYNELAKFTLSEDIEILGNPEVLQMLMTQGIDLNRFKKYNHLKQLFNLPDQAEEIKKLEQIQPKTPEPEQSVSTDESFQSTSTPHEPPKTGEGISQQVYKRMVVLLGAAKTGIKDENRTEFLNILNKLMEMRYIDKRARELLLSRFNKK